MPSLSPAPRPTEFAYRVPWRVERDRAPHFRLVNLSLEALSGVTFSLLGPGALLVEAPLRVLPGGHAEFVVHGEDLARRTVVVVRWFRCDQSEYLWHVSF